MIQQLLTEKMFYIFIAVIGFLSSLATLFIDVNDKISIKWILFETVVFMTLIAILIRTILILSQIKNISQNTKVIKYKKDDNILILKSNIEIPMNSLVSIYHKDNGYEELYGVGFVENIQENKLIALKVTTIINNINLNIKKVIIKTTLSNSILKGIGNE
jgi:hypothetical protein